MSGGDKNMSRGVFDQALAAETGVSDSLAKLAFSIYHQESGAGKNAKTSNRGAVGGMQVMPGTFREVADKDWDINDPVHNLRAGLRYLKKLDKLSGGDPALTAAGYYGGPGGMEKARRGIAVSDPMNPHAPNTLQYGAQVVARMGGTGSVPQAPVPVPQALPRTAAAPAVPAAGGLSSPSVVPPVDAPVLGKSGLPLPAELVAYLASRNQPAPVPAASNAWLSFLDGLRGSSAAQISHERANSAAAPAPAAPVAAQDIDWVGRFSGMAPAPTGRVDFSAFGNLVKRV